MSEEFHRDQYLAGDCDHREYYAQFVTPSIKRLVLLHIGDKAYLEQQLALDRDFNKIPISVFDRLSLRVQDQQGPHLRRLGDYPTMAGTCCILKEAARQIAEETNTKEETQL